MRYWPDVYLLKHLYSVEILLGNKVVGVMKTAAKVKNNLLTAAQVVQWVLFLVLVA